MNEAWHAAMVGAGCSLGLLLFEVAFILPLRRTNTSAATMAVFGVFVIAFTARMVLLLAGPKMSILGVRDGHSFGLGIAVSFLVGVAIEALLVVSKKK